MTPPILAAATFCIVTTGIHVASIAITGFRLRKRAASARPPQGQPLPPVSLVRPLCGIDNYAAETLRSTFALDYPAYEIVFCVAAADDPVIPLVELLIAAHPDADAKILIGDDRISNNPKLNNVLKGWNAARA